MIFLISLATALLFVWACGPLLRKKAGVFYIIAGVLAALGVLCTWCHVTLPGWISTWVLPVIARGGMAGALFVIVMVTGALPNGTAAIKRLMPIRGQLSILASILTLGHNLAYGKTYFVKLFLEPATLPKNQLVAAICSVGMLVIMLPLFVTSFPKVRKKMGGKIWKRLQRWAYLFYVLLCTHILLLTVPNALAGRSGYRLTVCVYSFVFLTYGICRVIKAVCIRRKRGKDTLRYQRPVVVVCAVIALVGAVIWHWPSPAQEEPAQEVTATAPVQEETSAASQAPEAASDSAEAVPEEDEMESLQEESPYRYNDGTYQASAMGNNGMITVSVTIEQDVIVDITLDQHSDDEPYISDAMAVIDWILEANSTEVDTVTGATWSSGGILDAVELALQQAEG